MSEIEGTDVAKFVALLGRAGFPMTLNGTVVEIGPISVAEASRRIAADPVLSAICKAGCISEEQWFAQFPQADPMTS